MMADSSPVYVIYEEQGQSDSGEKGLRDMLHHVVRKVGPLNEVEFRKNIINLCSSINQLLSGIEQSVSHFALDSIELSVEVKASGEIRFIGSVGGETKGGLKLAFKRIQHNSGKSPETA
jgi:hypothetical protein